jgi:hypothetical protein
MPELLTRKDVLAGAMFMAVAVLGLWVSREYPIGTALRMGTGYVPRLLCWVLLALGALVLIGGLRGGSGGSSGSAGSAATFAWRPLLFVAGSLVLFGLAIERLGLVIAILMLVVTGALASRMLRPLETLVAALALVALCWGIFILGLGLTIRLWPEW